MAENSKIQWTSHTWNPYTGCKKVSPGCKYCYMYRDQERYGKDPTEILEVSEKTQNKVFKAAKPGDKIFVCSWSDFFIEEADGFRAKAWERIRSRPDLIFQILTKRPENILARLPEDWGDGYPNVWLGISAENQDQFDLRMNYFCTIPAKVRFVSAEPLLGPLKFWPWMNLTKEMRSGGPGSAIDWVIAGGESGNDTGKYRYRESKASWYVDILNQCALWQVPAFMKQTGTHLAKELGLKDRHGGKMEEWPVELRVRQFPKV